MVFFAFSREDEARKVEEYVEMDVCRGSVSSAAAAPRYLFKKGKRTIATHTTFAIFFFFSRLRGRVRRALDKAERRRERLDLVHPPLPWTEVICACADFRMETADFADRFREGGGGEEEEMVVGVLR